MSTCEHCGKDEICCKCLAPKFDSYRFAREDEHQRRKEERLDRAWQDLGNTLLNGSRDGEGV